MSNLVNAYKPLIVYLYLLTIEFDIEKNSIYIHVKFILKNRCVHNFNLFDLFRIIRYCTIMDLKKINVCIIQNKVFYI